MKNVLPKIIVHTVIELVIDWPIDFENSDLDVIQFFPCQQKVMA